MVWQNITIDELNYIFIINEKYNLHHNSFFHTSGIHSSTNHTIPKNLGNGL